MRTRWWTGNAVGLDFETDGPDPTDARIITAGTAQLQEGKLLRQLDWLVQPERDIPEGASAVHGITTAHAKEFGMPRGDAVADIVAMLSACAASVPLVGHNVGNYDLTVLDREMRRLGLGSLGIEPMTGHVTIRMDGRTVTSFPVIDTLVIDKQSDRYRPGKNGRKLEAVARNYGVPMADGSAHAADADIMASLRIAWMIAKRAEWCAEATDADIRHDVTERTSASTKLGQRLYPGRRRVGEIVYSFATLSTLSLDELHTYQVRWSAEQVEGLRTYFRDNPGQGVDPDEVTGGWPFQPYI